jgi:hypothetical protein
MAFLEAGYCSSTHDLSGMLVGMLVLVKWEEVVDLKKMLVERSMELFYARKLARSL